MRLLFALLVLTFVVAPSGAQTCEDLTICVTKREYRWGAELYAHNSDSVDVRVTFTLQLDNLTTTPGEPVAIVVPAGQTRKAVQLRATDAEQRWGYRYEYRWRRLVRTATLAYSSGSGDTLLTAYYRGDSSRVAVDVVNGVPAPLTLDFTSMDSTISAPDTLTLAIGERRRVYEGAPPEGWYGRSERESFFYHINWNVGHPGVEPDPAARYDVPTTPGTVLIVQGRGRPGVAFGSGVQIAAARRGLVVTVQDGSTLPPNAARRLLVLHDDGTIAHYVDFANDTSRPTMGDRVEAGDVLADASDAPWSFAVFALQSDLSHLTVPICFDAQEGSICGYKTDTRLSPVAAD